MDSSSSAWSANTSLGGIKRSARLAIHEALGFRATTPIIAVAQDDSLMSLGELSKVARQLRWQSQNFAMAVLCTDATPLRLSPILRAPDIQNLVFVVEPLSEITQWILGADLLLLKSAAPMHARFQAFAESASIDLIAMTPATTQAATGVETLAYLIHERLQQRSLSTRQQRPLTPSESFHDDASKLEREWQTYASQTKESRQYENTRRIA